MTEQEVTCSTGPQAQTVERLASILLLVDPEAKDFLSRVDVAMTRRAQWSHCIPQAEQWARTGLKRLPKDGPLLMTLGIVLGNHRVPDPGPRPAGRDPGAPGGPAVRVADREARRLVGQGPAHFR